MQGQSLPTRSLRSQGSWQAESVGSLRSMGEMLSAANATIYSHYSGLACMVPDFSNGAQYAHVQQETCSHMIRATSGMDTSTADWSPTMTFIIACNRYSHVVPKCLEDSPTAKWWAEYYAAGGKQSDLVVHIEKGGDYDGLAVAWGINNKKANAEECAAQCLEHKPSKDKGAAGYSGFYIVPPGTALENTPPKDRGLGPLQGFCYAG
jgi:hypothetical protein